MKVSAKIAGKSVMRTLKVKRLKKAVKKVAR